MGKLTVPGPIFPVEIECETGKVSDGYHTFDELYDHRCLSFLAFLHAISDCFMADSAWKSRKHSDGSGFDGWFITGLQLPAGQISYHIPDKYWDLCDAPEREAAPEWDGHTSAEVMARLTDWLEH